MGFSDITTILLGALRPQVRLITGLFSVLRCVPVLFRVHLIEFIMPRAQAPEGNPHTSTTALAAALEAAPDERATWALIRGWRKRATELASVVASSVRHWDEGMVFMVFRDSYVSNFNAALENPAWPAWGDEAVIDWAIGAFSAEVAYEHLNRASRALESLRALGRLPNDHPALDQLVDLLTFRGRRDPKMATRHVTLAHMLVDIKDLAPEDFSRVALAIQITRLPAMAFARGEYSRYSVLHSALENPSLTLEWLLAFRELVHPAQSQRWDDMILRSARWKEVPQAYITPPLRQPARRL